MSTSEKSVSILKEIEPGTIESILKRDRFLVITGIVVITILSWAYMLHLHMQMMHMDMSIEIAMPNLQPWDQADFALNFLMWAIMMVAMMTPSAAPTLLVFASVNRRRSLNNAPFVPTGVFLSGYIFIWTIFSAVATLVQWFLHKMALLSPMLESTSDLLGGLILIGAGIYQWTSLKNVCLAHCRSPLDFLMHEWQEGISGAFMMGVKHGIYCVGCCWILMGLLFVAGVMNLLWVAIIAGFILIEKVVRGGVWVGKIAGMILVAFGILILSGMII